MAQAYSKEEMTELKSMKTFCLESGFESEMTLLLD